MHVYRHQHEIETLRRRRRRREKRARRLAEQAQLAHDEAEAAMANGAVVQNGGLVRACVPAYSYAHLRFTDERPIITEQCTFGFGRRQ
jgi:hypothetical protein